MRKLMIKFKDSGRWKSYEYDRMHMITHPRSELVIGYIDKVSFDFIPQDYIEEVVVKEDVDG